MIFASNIELKIHLTELCENYPHLNCTQLEIDLGQQFAYQMQSFFPVEFEKQVLDMMYD